MAFLVSLLLLFISSTIGYVRAHSELKLLSADNLCIAQDCQMYLHLPPPLSLELRSIWWTYPIRLMGS
jgi:hypothetical protein